MREEFGPLEAGEDARLPAGQAPPNHPRPMDAGMRGEISRCPHGR